MNVLLQSINGTPSTDSWPLIPFGIWLMLTIVTFVIVNASRGTHLRLHYWFWSAIQFAGLVNVFFLEYWTRGLHSEISLPIHWTAWIALHICVISVAKVSSLAHEHASADSRSILRRFLFRTTTLGFVFYVYCFMPTVTPQRVRHLIQHQSLFVIGSCVFLWVTVINSFWKLLHPEKSPRIYSSVNRFESRLMRRDR